MPEPGQDWQLPDGPPPPGPDEQPGPAGQFSTPPPFFRPPPKPEADGFVPPEPGAAIAQVTRRPNVVLLVLAGVLVVITLACLCGYLGDKLERIVPQPPGPATTSARAAGPAPAGSPSARPSGGSASVPPRVWVLAAPAKAGALRRVADHPPVADPYSAIYEDPLDAQHRAIVTGRVGTRFTADGPQAAVEGWLAAQDPPRAQSTQWSEDMMRGGPLAVGGVAMCTYSVGQPTPESWCAWASDGVVVEFVFLRVPVTAAWDRMAEMLPAIATHSP